MTSKELENLARTGLLKREPPNQKEFDGLLDSARKRLADVDRKDLSSESRFDLAYNAAHALSLAALRWHGYRPQKRYIVFQTLGHSLGVGSPEWRVLDRAHTERNRVEYEGYAVDDERLVAEMIKVTKSVLKAVEALGPVSAKKGQ